MKTNTIIEYGAVDITAKADSQLSTDDIQSFSQITELKKSNTEERKYSTLEKNFFVLNGEKENMGENIEVGYWSNSMSNSQGNFDNPISIIINFSHVHSSLGLTLKFSEYAYCNNLSVSYFDYNNELITEDTYYPDNYEYFCEKSVAEYKKIIITFYSTNIPYRYLKIYKIMYGRAVLFEGDDLVNANILEQVDILSNELSINTLDFVVHSNDDRFNILNPKGVYATLQEMQEIHAYQVKNNNIINMGTFYLKSWQNQSNKMMRFSASDLLGFLDLGTFDGGMYVNATAEEVIVSIFTSAGISSDYYTIQNELKNILIIGYMPQCSHREALQQVLFTIGAVANCSRSDIIRIYSIEISDSPNMINRSNILKATEEIEQGEIITGVLIKSHNYRKRYGEETFFDSRLTAGTHKIIFEQPVWQVNCTGGTIEEFSANYAIVSVPSSRDVSLTGYIYKDDVQDVLVQNNNLTGNESANVINIDSLYLINNSNAQSIGERIIDYYNKRFTSKFKFILDDEEVGENVLIEENYDNILDGFLTELDIDLTGGYIASAKVNAKVRSS